VIYNDIAALGGSLAAYGSMAGEEPSSEEEFQRQLRALTPANPAAPPQPSLGPAQLVLSDVRAVDRAPTFTYTATCTHTCRQV